MKTKLAALLLTLFTFSSFGAAVLVNGVYVVTNPAPVVQLAWNKSTTPGIASYSLYWGVASRRYTNYVTVGVPTTNASITLAARGVTYFFAATATTTNGLESDFSNEVSYQPIIPPASPGLVPPVTVIAQQQTGGGIWNDIDSISIDPTTAKQSLFRLKIAYAPPPPMPPGMK